MKTSGGTLVSFIEEMLDFSKIEAGRLDLAPRPFALAAFIEEAVELFGPRAQAKGLEICGYVDERLPARVIGDAARLRQVLFNLAGNAIKFTETGGVSIIVEPGTQPEQIAIAVRDTGIGIAPEDQARIFLEFEQADVRLDAQIRRHRPWSDHLQTDRRAHGQARSPIESAPGEGSTFRVTVPLPPRRRRRRAAAGRTRPCRQRILIVAPAAIEASLLARRLQRWGARTTIVPDEQVAAALLPEQPWSAMLVDHALGSTAERGAGATGGGDSAADRAGHAGDAPRTRRASRKRGFTGYLIKPVRAASLAARFAASDDAFDARRGARVRRRRRAQPGRQRPVDPGRRGQRDQRAACPRAAGQARPSPDHGADGGAAIECWLAARAAGTPFDRVLMDLHMPGMDGLEATRRIRAFEAEHDSARTPIIALTANASAEDRDACLAAGMDGFLVKPLDRDRLAALRVSAGANAARACAAVNRSTTGAAPLPRPGGFRSFSESDRRAAVSAECFRAD